MDCFFFCVWRGSVSFVKISIFVYIDNKEVRKRGVIMKRKFWIFIGVFVVFLGGYFFLFREKFYKVEVEKVNLKI